MKPTFSVKHNNHTAKIFQADAFEFLSDLHPNSVDMVVASPPYFMGKEYDRSKSIDDFVTDHKRMFPLIVKCLKPGGNLAWQVGHHVDKGKTMPLDALVILAAMDFPILNLRNRIIWTFGHGAHCNSRFSGRHESILWFSKSGQAFFNLDAVRAPQKYPGKKHYKGPRKGDFSGNPLGKNPGDVWEIPNVKAKHAEKTQHPCQYPVALIQRLIRALCPEDGVVVDPFLGSGTSAVAALLEERNFSGSELSREYIGITRNRLRSLKAGTLKVRPDVPIRVPKPNEAVSIRPPHFAS